MKLLRATINNISELQEICTKAYSQVFADHWTKNGLELYLEHEFGTQRLHSELKNDNVEYYFITKNDENIGFLKINYTSSNKLSDLDNCELEKIYILPKYSGMGIGKTVMNKIITKIKHKGKKAFFLCVIDTNTNAIAFYEKLGFQFHSKTRLEVTHFKEELRGMNRMCLTL
ncbi:GNAT family N-acetyltransferase [Aquimarina algicola]|uniref:GNAT family N-acetyltransferase n=1 Tax=Aquimarina algicola TaxID=2589995 RepID=A0A504JBM6_9FLAO|nr:GNAT family N-acetyltransferase [Aquimarina algicola]TPN85268.1 GNAT family N-acetyltransferase [Aquimarina algicola]